MAFENITMNLSALNNINPINISPSESTLSEIISLANTGVNDYIIFASLFIILIVVYLTLSDKTPYQGLGFDDVRALSIALNISVLISLTMVSVEWSNNFFAVGMVTTAWLFSLLLVYVIENKE